MENFGNDLPTIFCVTAATNSGKSMTRIFGDDTDVFALFVYWVIGKKWSARCRWSGGI